MFLTHPVHRVWCRYHYYHIYGCITKPCCGYEKIVVTWGFIKLVNRQRMFSVFFCSSNFQAQQLSACDLGTQQTIPRLRTKFREIELFRNAGPAAWKCKLLYHIYTAQCIPTTWRWQHRISKWCNCHPIYSFPTYVDDDVIKVVADVITSVVSHGFHDNAVIIIINHALRVAAVSYWWQLWSVVFLDPASCVGEPRWHLSQRHLADNRQHHLLRLGRVRVFDVLVQPSLQSAGCLATGVLAPNIHRTITAS